MIPYGDFLYFGVLLYVVVPTLVLGLAGRAGRRWILIATVAMLAVQFAGQVRVAAAVEVREIWIVAAFGLFEWAVASIFLRLRARANHRGVFYCALLLALFPLIVSKYVPVIAPSFQFGFLGISYVTFRALDIIICTQDRVITSLSATRFFSCLFFFATISAGPIDRYRRFEADWQHRRSRTEFLRDLDVAVHRVFIGFFYKFIIAALVKDHWLEPAAAQSGFINGLSFMYAYSLHLFFDFAGYSAFAIGISYLLGVHTPENFDRPFLARNIRDFWNRWHMTLSAWLRDHVYMRFVMAATKGRWFKSRYLASYLGFLLAFGLMGLWHGPAIHYLLYGLYHGLLLSASDAFGRWNKQRRLWGDGTLWHAAGVFGTFHCVCFGFLLFSGYLTDGWSKQPATPTQAYEGRYERASCDEIGGWAWNAGTPQAPVNVDIYADGRRVATMEADLPRADLAAAGKGNGAHAFVFVPPLELKDGQPHSISIRVSGSDFDLPPGPQEIVCVPAVRAMDGYDGDHESATCERIEGWAWDMSRPDEVVGVDIYADERLLTTVAAGRARDDLRDSGRAGGRHGFMLETPAALRDGRPHLVSIRIANTNIVLAQTPRILLCTEQIAAASPAPTPTPSGVGSPGSEAGATPTIQVPRSYTDNRDGTITDAVTGLMWEKKLELDNAVDGKNLNDADNCYPWFGKCAASDLECRVDADCGAAGPCRAADCQGGDGLTIFQWVARLNADKYAGYDDWRLPTSEDIYSIVNPIEERDPAANAAFNGESCGKGCSNPADPKCSCHQPGLYWAVPVAGPKPDESWMMFFYCNGELFLDLNTNKFFVRAVRQTTVQTKEGG